jgi:hypothetical protein
VVLGRNWARGKPVFELVGDQNETLACTVIACATEGWLRLAEHVQPLHSAERRHRCYILLLPRPFDVPIMLPP